MTMVNDIINEAHEKEIKALEEDYNDRLDRYAAKVETLELTVETLELELEFLQAAVDRFLEQDAPTVCDNCCETKLETSKGMLWCSLCDRGWDPRTGEWE